FKISEWRNFKKESCPTLKRYHDDINRFQLLLYLQFLIYYIDRTFQKNVQLMKKLLLFAFAISLGYLMPAAATAQPAPSTSNIANKKIPVDPNVKTGSFKNGLTYYIRHNDKPQDRLVLRLVVDAGSILE